MQPIDRPCPLYILAQGTYRFKSCVATSAPLHQLLSKARSAIMFNAYGRKSLTEVAFGPDPNPEDIEAVVQYLAFHSHPRIDIVDLIDDEAEEPIYWGEIKVGGVNPDGRRNIDSFSISSRLRTPTATASTK